MIEVTFDLRKSWDIIKKTSQRGLRQAKLRYFREKEEIFHFIVCAVGCFMLREGIRTSNETLSNIEKYHLNKAIVKLSMADYYGLKILKT